MSGTTMRSLVVAIIGPCTQHAERQQQSMRSGKQKERMDVDSARHAKGGDSEAAAAAATAAERHLIDGWMDGCGAVMESTAAGGAALSRHDRPTDRNAPSRRTPPGNQARFICNNPVPRRRRRHYSDVLLLSSGTKATPTSAAGDDEELFLNRRSSAAAVRSS